MRDDLLQPSLSIEKIAAAPPSTQAMFLTSFFGGPIAAVMMIAVASFRLRRLVRDLPLLIVLLGAPIGAFAWLQTSVAAEGIRLWIQSNVGSSGFEFLIRLAGLMCFGIGYWLHAQAHRNSALLGLKAPNGWLVGVPCIVIGFFLLMYILSWFEPTLPLETITT